MKTVAIISVLCMLTACADDDRAAAKPATPGQQQASYAAFREQALKVLDASDALTESVNRGLSSSKSIASGGAICANALDLARRFPRVSVPDDIKSEAQASTAWERLDATVAVRAAAYENCVDAARSGDQAKVVDMHGRFKRAAAHSVAARAALADVTLAGRS